jgi:hypothetical protein
MAIPGAVDGFASGAPGISPDPGKRKVAMARRSTVGFRFMIRFV